MTPEQFSDMLRQVEKGIWLLNKANVNDEDIGIIMSRDVYEMAAYKELLTIHAIDFRVVYRGYDVFLVQESDLVFAPVLKRFPSDLGYDAYLSDQIGTGSFILSESSDGGSFCVYMKTETHPAIFRETGLTVRIYAPECFGERMSVPVESPRYTFTWGEPGWSAAEESILAGVDGMIRENIVSTIMGTKTSADSGIQKHVKQKKLAPEDTKELDEFLGSFKVLESAT